MIKYKKQTLRKVIMNGVKITRKVNIGGIIIGGGQRVAVQTMSVFRPSDLARAIEEAQALKGAGCDILRYSVNDEADALAFSEIKAQAGIPLVADIHFDYRLALAAIRGGADKIRINPGNIGSEKGVAEVAAALKDRGIPVRVGSNTGSLEKEFLNKYGRGAVALGESALQKAAMLEKYGVKDIVLSVKATSSPLTVQAYKYISERCDYPLHIGVTEAGTEYTGIIKNALAAGALFEAGIGDTIRVSLSAQPIREVRAALTILAAAGLRNDRPEIIACPTCGRCRWNCMEFAAKTEEFVSGIKKPIKIAVMGCEVNGPGEAADADVGIAGGKDCCVIFSKGKIVKKVSKENAEQEFFGEIERCARY